MKTIDVDRMLRKMDEVAGGKGLEKDHEEDGWTGLKEVWKKTGMSGGWRVMEVHKKMERDGPDPAVELMYQIAYRNTFIP